MSRSAACGAWQNHDGEHAHQLCEGRVHLPAPDDVCACECHEARTRVDASQAQVFAAVAPLGWPRERTALVVIEDDEGPVTLRGPAGVILDMEQAFRTAGLRLLPARGGDA